MRHIPWVRSATASDQVSGDCHERCSFRIDQVLCAEFVGDVGFQATYRSVVAEVAHSSVRLLSRRPLLIPQRLHRMQPGGAPGRQDAGQHGDRHRADHDPGDRHGVDDRGNLVEVVDRGGRRPAGR